MLKHLSCVTIRSFFAVSIFLTAVAMAAPAGAAVQIDRREIMPVSEIKPGMRGYGRTVFRGVKIETFQVSVIGVLPKENLGRPLILVRMEGGPISERDANIIGGMSGSPVYINNRLVGAVAYGQTFPREPIAMLTPIEDMLEALDPALESAPAKPAAKPATTGYAGPPALPQVTRLSKPLHVGGNVYNRVRFSREPFHVARAGHSEPGTLQMAPLATAAMVSGISARSMERLTDALRPFGVEPMAGPGGLKYDKPIPIEPGSAAGASMIVGDVDMTAVGTVTYRKGNKILAFGHPFMQMGAVDMPLTTAWVHDVFPSIMRSFKIASPVNVVGSVRQDRPWGIGGEMGRQPIMIPVEASVRDFGTERRQTLKARVVDNRFITGQLLAMVVNEAIFRIHSVPGDATARVKTEIETREFGRIQRENLYYDPTGIDSAALGDLLSGVMLLTNNPWQRVDVKGVKVSVDIDASRRTAVIERAVVDKEKYEPGDTVQIQVTLRPWEKEPVTRTLSVKIPEHAPDGRVSLRVGGGSGMGAMLAPPQDAGPQQPGAAGPQLRLGPGPMQPATSLKQLVQNYLEKERNSDLVARLSLPSYTANIEGQKMRTVPPHLLDVMRNPRNSGLRLQNDEVKVSEPTTWVLTGGAAVSLSIERRTFGEKPGAPGSRPTPTPPPSSPGDMPRPAMDSGMDDEGDFTSSLMPAPVLSGGWFPRQPRIMQASAASPAVAVAATPNAGPAGEAPKPPTPAGEAAAQPPAGKPEGAGADDPSKKKPEVDAAPVKPAGRAPVAWKQNTAEAFERGRLVGLSTSSRGELTLSRTLEKVRSLDASYVWSLVAANGAVYAGSGDKGALFRIQGDAVTSVLKSDELQVLSLARDGAGNVYAGTAPHGLVYKVTPDGKSDVFWRTGEEYVLSLAVDSRGNVYAGTSPEGRIYRITPDGQGALFARVPDPYVVSLAVAGDALYAGTGGSAAVFRVTADGKVSTFYDPAEGNTASVVATDPQGHVYIGTSPRGAVLRLDGEGKARVLQERSPAGITALAVDGRGIVWAATGSSVYRIENGSDEPSAEKIDNQNGPKFLALALDEGGNIALGTATGDVYRLAAGVTRRGELQSAVRDAGSVARWGRLSWIARTPAGTSVALQTRSGNSEEPDPTWSAWSEEITAPGKVVTSPAARYFQYRAILTGEVPETRPVVSEVSVVYMPRNQAPKLTVAAPRGGEVWSRKQTIRWSGTDADQDTLLYDVFVSGDNGTTWKRLDRVVKEAVPAGPGSGPLESGKKPGEGSAGEGEKPKEPGVGESLAPGKKPGGLLVGAQTGGSEALPPAPKPPAVPPVPPADATKAPEPPKRRSDSMKETSLPWDTTEVQDGRYLVKIVASDRLSNPTDAYSIERIIGPIQVCNTPPKLTLAGDPHVAGERTVQLTGAATSTVPIAGVDYRIDDGEWASAAPADGIFDGEAEPFEIRTSALEPGERTIEVRVVDAGGNQTKETRKVVVR